MKRVVVKNLGTFSDKLEENLIKKIDKIFDTKINLKKVNPDELCMEYILYNTSMYCLLMFCLFFMFYFYLDYVKYI